MVDQLIQIDSGFACFGLVAQQGAALTTAPICRWAVGKQLGYVLNYWRRRGAKVTYVSA